MSEPAAHAVTVLHVDTERGWRGGEQQVVWLAEAQRRRGDEPLIAARTGEPLIARAAIAGISTIAANPSNELAIVEARRLRREIERRHFDVVHAHSAHAVALSALATRGTRAKLVVTRHVEFRLKANAFTRWKYGRADAVIAISDAAARVLAESGIAPEKITVVPGGIDLRRLAPPASNDALAALGVRPEARLVILIAALTAEKDPTTFVRAMALVRDRVPRAQGLIVGDGPEMPAVRALLSELGLEGFVRLAGFREDARSLLAVAHVAALTSRNEGLPVAILEALAAGVPIVATAAGGVPDVVRDRIEGLIVPVGDATAVGDAMVRLLTDDRLHARLRAGARARAAQFSIDDTAERIAAVYARVLSSGR